MDADTYVEWESNLHFLLKHMFVNGPYVGVLGFSQGGNIALLLTAIKESGCMPWLSFDFVVLMSASRYSWCDDFKTTAPLRAALPPHMFGGGPGKGNEPLLEAGYKGSQPKLATPSLHIVGSMDPMKDAGVAMSELFTSNTRRLEEYKNAHKPPTAQAAGVALAEFVRAAGSV